MDSRKTKPALTHTTTNQLHISGVDLGKLFDDILSTDTPLRFTATGGSMRPFILDGDILTIAPMKQCKPGIGVVAAFVNPGNRSLLVHRIIARRGSSLLIKADNSTEKNDGWIQISQLLGCVTEIQRGNRKLKFGLGIERFLLAFLSKHNLLRRIAHRLSILFD